ncbi:MAG TPA: hypothetical protein VLB29_13925 [Nocardioidaceae bacterium]|nr:hypothetical protein [Nocardioidaceae bacterium]
MSTPLSQARSLPRFAEAAVERARLTVVPRRTQKAPRVPFVSLVSLLLIGGIVGLLLFNTNMQQASFVASSMEEQAAVLAGKEESLRMQLDRLRDPQHVAAQAKKLGMVPASNPAFIRLSDGKVLGRPSVAEPTDTLQIAPPAPTKPESLRPKLVIVEAPRARRDRAAQRRDTARRSAAASRSRGAESRTKRNQNAAAGAGRSGGRTP